METEREVTRVTFGRHGRVMCVEVAGNGLVYSLDTLLREALVDTQLCQSLAFFLGSNDPLKVFRMFFVAPDTSDPHAGLDECVLYMRASFELAACYDGERKRQAAHAGSSVFVADIDRERMRRWEAAQRRGECAVVRVRTACNDRVVFTVDSADDDSDDDDGAWSALLSPVGRVHYCLDAKARLFPRILVAAQHDTRLWAEFARAVSDARAALSQIGMQDEDVRMLIALASSQPPHSGSDVSDTVSLGARRVSYSIDVDPAENALSYAAAGACDDQEVSGCGELGDLDARGVARGVASYVNLITGTWRLPVAEHVVVTPLDLGSSAGYHDLALELRSPDAAVRVQLRDIAFRAGCGFDDIGGRIWAKRRKRARAPSPRTPRAF